MRHGWLVLLLALLLGDVTAARGDDFTIATSAEQVAVLQPSDASGDQDLQHLRGATPMRFNAMAAALR